MSLSAAQVAVMKEKRKSPRRAISRLAKIEVDSLLCGCLVTDISDGGVRLYAEGVEVPDTFVLLLPDDNGMIRPCDCRVVWRLGHELGARFIRTSGGTSRSRTGKGARRSVPV